MKLPAPLMLPQWRGGYIRRPHKLGRRGLVRLHKRRPVSRAVMGAPYPQVESRAYRIFFAAKTGEAPAAGDACPAAGLAA